MHDDSGRRGRRTIQDQRTSLEQQIVLGHLLPHYQAAQAWQDTVRAQRLLQSVAPTVRCRARLAWSRCCTMPSGGGGVGIDSPREDRVASALRR